MSLIFEFDEEINKEVIAHGSQKMSSWNRQTEEKKKTPFKGRFNLNSLLFDNYIPS